MFFGLIALYISAFVLWLYSLKVRRVTFIDTFWSLGFALSAWLYTLNSGNTSARHLLMVFLINAWAFRLARYLHKRNRGHEDRRYQKIASGFQPNWQMKSLFVVFGLQASLNWIVGGTLYVSSTHDEGFSLRVVLGFILLTFGIVWEAWADRELVKFKSDPSTRGQTCRNGPWQYSRHPNYFGNFCIWWGVFLVSVQGLSHLPALLSPLVMSFLLMRVSGVPMTSEHMRSSRSDYAEYLRTTNTFFPWPPRK